MEPSQNIVHVIIVIDQEYIQDSPDQLSMLELKYDAYKHQREMMIKKLHWLPAIT